LEILPTGHGTQDCKPVLGAKVPISQRVQRGWPELPAIWPAGH